MPRIPSHFVTMILLAALLSAGMAHADGGEDLDHAGERIRSLRIPVHLKLRSWKERPFGLRLRLAVTLANSDLYDIVEGDLNDVKVGSFVPGLEFVIPVGKTHLLLPHFDAGLGTESETDETVFLGSIGLRSEFIFAGKHFFTGLEPGFRVNNRSGDDLATKATFSPFLTVSARRVLGFTIKGHQPDAGVFFETGYDFNALELSSVKSTNDAINTNLEIGAGVGFSQSRPKIWLFRVPRIRIGYRFGDLEGWRLRIGGDWLDTVVGLSHPGSTD